MGFLDAVKERASALAADAERAGKVTAAQARLALLRKDVRKAERDLGREAYALIEAGEIAHAGLAVAAQQLRAAEAEVSAKETEIAELRAAAPDSAPDVAPDAAPASAEAAPEPAEDAATEEAPTKDAASVEAPAEGAASE